MPDFATLKPVGNQPDFSTLKPVVAIPTVAALDPTTRATQATFPATGNESALGIAAKTIGNIPSSAFGFAKGVVDFLNPYNTIKTAQNIGTTIGGALNEGQKIGALAKNTILGLPQSAWQTLAPQFMQHAVSGDFTRAAATLENDPIGQIAPILFVAKAAAQKAGVGAQFDQAISTIASPVTKSAETVGGGIKNIATGATKFGSSQLTGLSPQTLEQVVKNPDQFSKDAQATVTRPALADEISKAIQERQTSLDDTGAGYSGIKTLTEPIPVEPTYLDRLITSTTGLDVSNGRLSASGSSSIRLPSDVSALQTKLYNTWQPEFAKGYLTPEQFLNFRSDLSKMVYNDSGIGKSTDLANLSSVMRGKVNTDLRPHVPGLEAVDSEYAPQLTELKQLSQGLVGKDGNLTDAAINRIANATGKGKDPQLARLEQLSPGITDKIRILKAVEDIQNSRENKPGTYLRAGALTAGLATLNPYLIVSAVMSLPEVAIPLLRGMGYSDALITKTLSTLGLDRLLTGIKESGNAVINVAPAVSNTQNNK